MFEDLSGGEEDDNRAIRPIMNCYFYLLICQFINGTPSVWPGGVEGRACVRQLYPHISIVCGTGGTI